jgi:hypothetical protein
VSSDKPCTGGPQHLIASDRRPPVTPTKRAILAHHTDPRQLIAVVRDLCAAAAVAFAGGDFLLGDALIDDAEEVLEIRSAATHGNWQITAPA